MVAQRYSNLIDPVRTERRIELALVLLVIALVVQLALMAGGALFSRPPATVLPSEDTLSLPEVTAPIVPTVAQSEAIQARPLFWTGRRPLEAAAETSSPEEAAEAKAADEIKNLKLLGVFGSADSGGVIALVKGKKQRILAGEDVLGWRLESVHPDRAILLRNGQRKEIVLVVASAKP
jgi:hypothetical protein